MNDVNFFDKGMKFLPPGHKKEVFIASYAGGNEKVLRQKPIEITIFYKKRIWNRTGTYIIDFDEFRGIMHAGETSLDKIAKSISEIRKDLNLISKKI